MLPDVAGPATTEQGGPAMAYLLAGLGGALGALARWGVAEVLPSSPGGWPWATLLVNLTGCLLLGALFEGLVLRAPEASWPRPLLGAGVLGGYTTFSTFAVEVVWLAQSGAVVVAGAYVVVSVLGGIAAVAAGTSSARALLGRSA